MRIDRVLERLEFFECRECGTNDVLFCRFQKCDAKSETISERLLSFSPSKGFTLTIVRDLNFQENAIQISVGDLLASLNFLNFWPSYVSTSKGSC